MRLTINGCPKYARNTTVRKMTHFCAKKLLVSNLNKKIKVTINFVKDLEKDLGILGDVGSDGEKTPRNFDIRIDKDLPKNYLLKTIAHEITHVKQLAIGELRDIDDSKVRWQNKIYKTDKIDRWDQPWEIEAHGREIGLYAQWYDKTS